MIPEVLTLPQLATYLQLPKDLVKRKVEDGEIPAAKIGKAWRVRKSLIDEWLDEQARLSPQTFDWMMAEARKGMRRAGIRTRAEADQFLCQIRVDRRAKGKR
jgi:excisionase family DNA binding protein